MPDLVPGKMNSEKKPPGCGQIALGGFVVMVILIFVLYGCISSENNSPDSPRVQQTQAIMACEDRVVEQMRSPSTANVGDTEARLVGERWIVDGWVDAQNGFGATVRADFSCSAVVNGETVTTRIISLEQR